MGFSRTKIYNMALHNLGVSYSIQNTNQNDAQTTILNNFYEISRDAVLEAHEWSFANAYKELSVTVDASINPNYQFSFTCPNDCISPRATICSFDNKEKKFELAIASNGEKIILANHNPLLLRYTKRIENETLFTAHFAEALAFYLAYKTAMAIVGSENKKNSNLQDYNLSLRKAIVYDARKSINQDQDDLDYTDLRY